MKLELLKDHDTQNEAGEKLECLYRNVNLGSLARIALWWMQDDIVLTFDQLENFISRFHLPASDHVMTVLYIYVDFHAFTIARAKEMKGATTSL